MRVFSEGFMRDFFNMKPKNDDELLATLKRIEAHLEKIASCVQNKQDYAGRSYKPCINTKKWSD